MPEASDKIRKAVCVNVRQVEIEQEVKSLIAGRPGIHHRKLK